MKKKKGLFAVVIALAVSSVMGAMAYTNSIVTNAAALKIVSTNSALLSIKPTSSTLNGIKDGTCEVVDGNLVFNFSKGKDGKEFGLQKNSIYQWFNDEAGKYYGLFTVTNNTENDLFVTIKAENVPAGVTVEAVRCWTGSKYSGWGNISNGAVLKTPYWNPGANNDFGIKITIGNVDVTESQLANIKITVAGDIK